MLSHQIQRQATDKVAVTSLLPGSSADRQQKNGALCRDWSGQENSNLLFRSHVCCFIHQLIWGSANGGWIFVPRRVVCNGLLNGNTSPSKVFRCGWPVNRIACVRTLSSLKYAYHVHFDPAMKCLPFPHSEIVQAAAFCTSLTCKFFLNLFVYLFAEC